VVREAAQRLESRGTFEAELRLAEGAGDAAAQPWLSLSLRRTGRDDEIETVAVISDISALKAPAVEVEELARERELMFDLSDVGIAYERSGWIGRANQALADLSRLPRSALTAMPIERLYESPKSSRSCAHASRAS
jgi:hypothetical protein